MITNNGSIAVQYTQQRGMVRLIVGCAPTVITAELSPDKARECAQALIDASARAEGGEALNSGEGVYRP